MQMTIIGALYNLQQSEINQIEFLISRQNSAKRMIFQDLYKDKKMYDFSIHRSAIYI